MSEGRAGSRTGGDSEYVALEGALAAGRPDRTEDAARQLHIQAVKASALGGLAGLPRLGRFLVEARVGAGGMGVVFRGRELETGLPVALKLLRNATEEDRLRLVREALVLRTVRHPHVVRYLDHCEAGGVDYLVMEWLDGRDLSGHLGAVGLSIDDAVRLGLALAQALQAVHHKGITHRDVKPSNVFLVGDRLDDARLIDFGIAHSARASHDGRRLTATGVVLGSPRTMAPEQLRGEHDARTDVYGLGATLFECLTGRPPFTGDEWVALLVAIETETPPRLATLRGDVPPGLDALVARMLAKDRMDRPPDMGAVVSALAALVAGGRPEVERERRSPAPTPRPTPPLSPRPPGGGPMCASLVGRVRELSELRGLLDEAASGQASVAFVTGPWGCGKSHLLAAIAEQEGWLCLIGRGAGAPFGALRALIASAASCEPSAVASLAALDHASGSRRAAPPVDAWLDAVDAWTRRGPVLLVVDDGDSLDEPSRSALDRALRVHAQRAVALIVATDEAPPTLGSTLDGTRRLTLPLGPLRRRAAEQLATCDARYVADVVRVAAGHPAHLLELCHQARERGEVPTAPLAALLRERVRRLPPGDLRLLRELARPEGGSTIRGALTAGAQEPRHEALCAAGLLRSWVTGEGHRYELDRHVLAALDLTRDA